ncbi:hypothetical protein R2601_04198 [Salipiger bermudensis HTCC2601]|uniref:Uncharacterized protein n=1 Tax=Salipiger bermudensis (strain DSM 26914 / JCM 13377 / KCTC 12554 / HTCC2601) TaxID=314265 RepID=Q0FW06_SALBH|nr:hypothetical protein R2601_04198 [Salipiger bermudensis HTCC2601]
MHDSGDPRWTTQRTPKSSPKPKPTAAP